MQQGEKQFFFSILESELVTEYIVQVYCGWGKAKEYTQTVYT